MRYYTRFTWQTRYGQFVDMIELDLDRPNPRRYVRFWLRVIERNQQQRYSHHELAAMRIVMKVAEGTAITAVERESVRSDF